MKIGYTNTINKLKKEIDDFEKRDVVKKYIEAKEINDEESLAVLCKRNVVMRYEVALGYIDFLDNFDGDIFKNYYEEMMEVASKYTFSDIKYKRLRFRDGNLIYIYLVGALHFNSLIKDEEIIKMIDDLNYNLLEHEREVKATKSNVKSLFKKERKDVKINYEIVLKELEKHVIKRDDSNFNYGLLMQKVFVVFDISLKDAYDVTFIPASILKKVLNNSLYPSIEIVNSLISLLMIIKPETLLEIETLRDAVSGFQQLRDEVLERNEQVHFTIYSETNLSQYELCLKMFDRDLLERVKWENYDWYVKFATYNYILMEKMRFPRDGEYFYDGSEARKWFFTQKNILEEPLLEKKFKQDRVKMLEYLIAKKEEIANLPTSISKDEYVKRNFADIFLAFKQNIEESGKMIDLDTFYGMYSLRELYNYVYQLYLDKNSWLSEEQASLVRRLRDYQITVCSEGNDILAKWSICLDALGLSKREFSSMCNINNRGFVYYTYGKTLPSLENEKKMIDVLKKIDRNSLRENQKSVLDELIIFVSSYGEKRKKRVKVKKVESALKKYEENPISFGNSRNLEEDVDEKIIANVRDNSSKWFAKFMFVYTDLIDENSPNTVSSYTWYKNTLQKAIRGELSLEQETLLAYLIFLSQCKINCRRNVEIEKKINYLENFNNGLIAEPSQETFNQITYSLKRSIFRRKGNVVDLLGLDLYLRVKKVLKNFYKGEFKLSKKKFYIGFNLRLLWFDLGLSEKKLCELVGCDNDQLHLIYIKKQGITLDVVTKIVGYLKTLDYKSLRDDQIDDVLEFFNMVEMARNCEKNVSLKNVKQ